MKSAASREQKTIIANNEYIGGSKWQQSNGFIHDLIKVVDKKN